MTQFAYLDQLAAASATIEQHEASARAARRAARRARRVARKAARRTAASLPGLTVAETRALTGLGTALDLPLGTRVATQGEPGREAFLLVTGRLAVLRDGDQVAEIRPGQLAGELSVLGQQHRIADVVASTAVRVLVFTPAELREALARVPALAVQAAERRELLDARDPA